VLSKFGYGKKLVGSAMSLFALGTNGCIQTASAGKPLSACRAADPSASVHLIHLPFDVIDGRIYVSARVNGDGPFRFAIDTGASGIGRADASLVSKLGLNVHGEGSTSDGVSIASAKLVTLKTLELGGLKRENVEVITRDYASRMSKDAAFAGIIGREFFADGLLEIDYPARTLRFSRDRAVSSSDDGALPYERAFRVPVTINGIAVTGNLDTGANVAFVLPQTLFDKVSDSTLIPAGQGTLTNSTVDMYRATVSGPFEIGAIRAHNIEVRVSERFPELLVGAHFLQNYRLLIDQRSGHVAICQ
jgi:predicted aspartyl protease